MQGEIFPVLERLIQALAEASRTTTQISKTLRDAETEAEALFRGEAHGGEGAPKSDEGGSLWDRFGEWVHGGLDVLGLVPGLGEIADGINGTIYLAEGRHLEAGLSFAAMIPFAGWGATVSKFGLRAGREILEESAERLLRQGAETATERAAREVAARNAAERLGTLSDVTSTEARQLVDEVATRSTNVAFDPSGAPVNRVVLGEWVEPATVNPLDQSTWGYVQYAQREGGIWYETADGVYDGMRHNSNAPWAVNEQFLRGQMEAGVERIDFVSGDVLDVYAQFPDKFRGREIGFLLDNADSYGYVRVGNSWIRRDLVPSP